MEDILQDLSPPALAYAVKANLLEFFRYLRRAKNVEFYANQKLVRWHTPIPYPWFNGVLCAEPPSSDEGQSIQDTVAYFKSRNVAVFTWWLEPHLEASDWRRQLLAHGLGYDEDTPGMAADLNALNEDLATPADLRILPVQDLAGLREWIHTFILGYELPGSWEADFFDLMAGLGLDLPVRNYTGYLNGEPVATSSLFLGARVAGVQCVATLPQARGRGIGAALSLEPLRDARAMGYRAGVLQSSEMGFRVYQKLGFQKLCNVSNYYWRN